MKHMYRVVIAMIVMTVALATPYALATTLVVGDGYQYANPVAAAQQAQPGDTILIMPGSYQGTFFINDLHGTENAWITIMGQSDQAVVFDGGTESMHFSECSYLRIERFTVTGQQGNGMNIDDGGTYDTPTHHIVVANVRFRDMGGQGNNDMLKLSGLDDFRIEHCSFLNGASGGSGIDMVGCHQGTITQCSFENMGSNAIQAKGGTQHLRIERNHFRNAGARGINLGGNTGLDFFRPIDAPFEAADLFVFANVFEGSQAPVAYVGSTRVSVTNNVFRNPGKWIFRILQETTEPEGRFVASSNGFFCNNIVLHDPGSMPTVNIGDNTDPASFTVSNNLFYDGTSQQAQPFANYPFTAVNTITGVNPLLTGDCPDAASPVVGAGIPIPGLIADLEGKPWGIPPSIGACEVNNPTIVTDHHQSSADACVQIIGYGHDGAWVEVAPSCTPSRIHAYDLLGRLIDTYTVESGRHFIPFHNGWQLLQGAR